LKEKFKEKDRSVELSLVGEVVYSDVPFRHLIVVGQIANWEVGKVLEIIDRTGYRVDEITRKDVERRLRYAKRWIEKYAPERIKFEIPEKVCVNFSEEERKFLRTYAERLKNEMTPEEIHTLVYEVSKELGIKSSKTFEAIYKAILGKPYGPRVGYFIKSLGVDWVKERIKAAL